MLVKATREGLEGKPTATGWLISNKVSFCALPSYKAKHRHVRIYNPLTNLSTIAEVLDVGPWSEDDDPYVFHGARPMAEANKRKMYLKTIESHVTNGAGIDLGQKVWDALGMKDNTQVEWEFI